MSGAPNRVFLARLAGLPVYDPAGDQVGRVRDVVVVLRHASQQPRVLALVVEVLGRRRVFLPMTRVTSVEPGHVISNGVVNVRRFERRATETLVLGELFDRSVRLRENGVEGVVYDVAMEQGRNREWFLSKVAVREGSKRLRRRGQSHVVDWRDVVGLAIEADAQGASNLLATFDSMRPVDLANVLRGLSPKRRGEIAAALGDERLADVLEELPEEEQVEILGRLDTERAADVLEEMSPDDAADLIAELPAETAERLLLLMEPEEARDVRRLLSYEERTAGGLMTTEPVILPPSATLADALARMRHPELNPSLAAMVYVCRAPLETPTGRFLGVAHFQRLLREPPSTLVSAVIDNDIEPLRPESTLEEVAALLAAYNLVASPVVDENGHLVGVVTVDDVLDHMLPDDWRDRDGAAAAGRADHGA
ncbi:MAG: CBS domain-containing protein [Actinomycetota bacterium]|nr:CBS domain-containing protein [Actinomycetota bacterium]